LGGGQQVLLRHLPYWAQAGTEHVVVYFEPVHTLASALESAGADVVYIPWRDLRDWPRTFRTLVQYIEDEKVDVLHTNGTPVDKLNGHLLSLRTARPMVTTLHGVRPRLAKRIPATRKRISSHSRFTASRHLERLLEPRTVNRFVVVSDAVKENWASYLQALGVPATGVQVIYSGIRVEDFTTPLPQNVERVRTELNLGPGPILISVGRLAKGKNLHVLVAAVEQLRAKYPHVQLLLAGGGKREAALRALATRLGLDEAVRFLGPRKDLPELFAVSDLFLFPSGQEGFGLVVLEALAAGLPVVTTRLPSLRKLWSREIGIELAAAATPQAFAEAVEQALSRIEEVRTRASLGQEVVRSEWSASASAAQYLALYREVAAERPGFRR
jgi:glycosyltransferase involved in cell wall biosynthesis